MRRKILLIAGIVVLFMIAFVGAIFWMLPTDSIRHLAEKTIEKQLKQKQSVEIEDLSISPLLNVTMKGFRMTPRVADMSAAALATEGGTFDGYYCAPYVEDQSFVIDKIFVSPTLSSLLSEKYAGKFELKLRDGIIDGSVKTIEKKKQLMASGKSISLNEFALLSNVTKTQLYGDLSFDLRATTDANKLAELSVKMNSNNTVMCPKRFKLKARGIPYIAFPFTIFGNIVADIEIANDKIIINQLTSDGPDIVLKVTGDIMLKSSKNPDVRLNLVADIKPSQSWVEDNDMKVIYQVCEKLDDGGIRLTLRGTTKKLKHDCGTPIPEPVVAAPVPEAPNADASAEKPKTAKEKTVEEKKEVDDKPAAEPAAERPTSPRNRAMPSRPTIVGEKKKVMNDAVRRPFDSSTISEEQIKKHPELFDLPKTGKPELDRRLQRIDEEFNRDFQNQPSQQERSNQRARYMRSVKGE